MKKVSIIFLTFFLFAAVTMAQKRNPSNQRITSSTYLENLIKSSNTNNYVITSEYTDAKNGIKHTYIRQAINGIEVYGTESSIHTDASGKTIVAHVNFVDEIERSVKNASAGISAEQAIARVAQQRGYNVSNLQKLESLKGTNQKGVFNKGGISKRDIPVKLMYYYQDGIGTTMVWELSIVELDGPDWWNFYVDAASGVIIDKANWTVNCNILGDHSDHGHEVMAKNKKNTIAHVKAATQGKTITEEIFVVGSAYTVFELPLENPYIGPRTTVSDPDDLLASPLGWHNDNTNSYAYTKGNNVSAYQDGSDDDVGIETDHTPESATGSVYDYAFDLVDSGSGDPVYTAALQSEDAAITNLFYWNNIVHDITYQYGFDEASGNFQEANIITGDGLGGDSVNAEAQDSADLTPTGFNRCNANFGTPPDGGNPRMQMYICDFVTDGVFNDGDYDNNVIVHEYAHGISNRLTGGPADAGALNNAEQMGEGWSDFYGYMLTMDGSNFSSDRPIGNFLFEQGPGGGGIRNAPYSTSLTTNPFTYADVADSGTISSPHGIGFIWATMLYEMTQNLIAIHGFDPNLYTGTGGNNIAIELVTLGLKLQPAFPGFVDGRDAILMADEILYGGANACAIWEAFAKRGLGISADQGSSGSRSDGVESFDLVSFVPSRTTICITEGVVNGIGGGLVSGGTYSDASGLIVVDGGDGLTFSFDPVVAGIGDHIVTYTELCSGLMTTASATITVTSGIPELVCQDVTVSLDAGGSASIEAEDVVSNLIGSGTLGYTSDQTGTFAPETLTGGATTVALGDDSGTGPVPLGFTFNYFGTAYTDIYITSNGYVSLTGITLGDFSPDALPSGGEPNGMIAVAWDDWSPNVAGTISYEMFGSAPTRKMVVEYDAVPHFSDAATTLTAQLHLYEGSNLIEIHTTNATDNGGVRTQGIENVAGDMGVETPGRNLAAWGLTSDYAAFVPIPGGLPDNCGNPVAISFSQSAFTCNDLGDIVVTVTADDGVGGISSCDTTVTVTDPLSPCAVKTDTIINELDADTAGTDTMEFIELYDGGDGNSALDGLVLVFYNGSNNLSYASYDLDGQTTNAEGYFVIGNAAVPNVSIVIPSNGLQNGADAVGLYIGDGTDFPNGSAVSTTNLLDALVYDTNDSDDPELLILLNAGEAQVNEGGAGDKDAHSMQRIPNGAGGARNTSTYTQLLPTPGVENTDPLIITCPGDITVNTDPGQCGAAVTFAATATGTPEPTISYGAVIGGATVPVVSGFVFPVGTTTVTATATNEVDSDSCTFTVTVNDTEDPVAICPADIVQGVDPGNCDAVVTFAPSATDNCPGVTFSSVPASGSIFPVGTTNVTVTATDASDNTDTCTFDVTVEDNVAPIVTDVQDIIAVLDNTGNVVLNNNNDVAPAVTASDNCDIDWIRIRGGKNNRTFGCADILTNPNVRTIRVRDVNGNNTDVPVNVIVQDNRPQGNYDGDALGDLCDEDDDNDGCDDIVDPHPFSIQTATVVINGCDSSVANDVLGCSTLADILMDICLDSGNYSEYRENVSRQLLEWRRAGIITRAERTAIFRCAINNYNGCAGSPARMEVADSTTIEFGPFEVNAYPNPSSNAFNFRITTENKLDKVDIQVMDITGKRVHFNTFDSDESHKFGESLQAGIYFVTITQGEYNKTLRVIKH